MLQEWWNIKFGVSFKKEKYFNFKTFDFKIWSLPKRSLEESESDIINTICRSEN